MAVHNHGTEDGPGLGCPEQMIDGKPEGVCMTDRCGNCGHDEVIHSGGCWFAEHPMGTLCSCHEFRKKTNLTLELRRCDRAGCGHPKFRHDHNGICRSCWCNTFIDRPAWRDSMQSWEPAPDKKEKPPMPDDEWIPLAEDVRHASRVLKALSRQEFSGYQGFTASELWDKAEQMDREAEDEKRHQAKKMRLAVQIRDALLMRSGNVPVLADMLKVAERLLDAGWDQDDE